MNSRANNFRRRIYRWEGLAFNAACAVYFVTLAPIIVAAANTAMRDPERTVAWFGALVIGISLAEIYAFPVKMRFVREAAREQGDEMGAGFLLWMFHAVISIILLFLAAGAFGFPVEGAGESDMPWWLAALIPVVVIKELVFLGFLFHGGGADSRGADLRYQRPNRREWLADLILVVYACVAYSATWSAITTGISMEKDNPVMFIVNLVVSSLLFLMFYLPLRIPYWLEEMARAKTARDAWMLVGSILLVLVPAIARLG
jgi:hypothetical protein